MDKTEFVKRAKALSDKKVFNYDDVVELIALLRCEHGCPWDRQVTHSSIRQNAIEEAYELVDAINQGDSAEIAQELGDMLLQVVLHMDVAQSDKEFEPSLVYTTLCKKLLARHTHVFGEDKANNAEQALDNWEKNKSKERKSQSVTDYLRQVPICSPALLRAYKVQKRAAKVGFDWDDKQDALEKVLEEFTEAREQIATKNANGMEEELGDLLFALVNVFRFCEIDPEVALTRCTEKFIRRFAYIEQELNKQNRTPEQSNLAEMDALWEQCKRIEHEKSQ